MDGREGSGVMGDDDGDGSSGGGDRNGGSDLRMMTIGCYLGSEFLVLLCRCIIVIGLVYSDRTNDGDDDGIGGGRGSGGRRQMTTIYFTYSS